MIFEKLADKVVKHPKFILLVWIVLLLASAYPAMHASEHFDYDTTNIGTDDSEAMEGAKIMGEHFDSLIETSNIQSLVIVYDPALHDAGSITDVKTAIIPVIIAENENVISVSESGFYPESGMLMLAIMYSPSVTVDYISQETGNLRDSVDYALEICGQDVSDFTTYVTGGPAITYDTAESTARDISIVDPIAIFMIIVLVGLFFRSFLSSAAAPMVIGCALAIVLGLIFFIGQVMSIGSYVQIILIVSMLGAGCDYCIFILSRYREERRSGKDHVASCREAITWAGESVATSGAAVIIGFGAMSICSFGIISSLGMMLALGIVIAILAALTMMSSVLVLLGDRLFWPTGAASPKLEKGYVKKFGNVAARYFRASTRFSIRHAKAILVASILFTIPMAYVFATAEDSYDMVGAMMSGESADGMVVVQEYVGGGSVMPNYCLFETGDSIATVSFPYGPGLGCLAWNTEYADRVIDELKVYADEITEMEYIASATPFNKAMEWKNVSLILSWVLPEDTPIFSEAFYSTIDSLSTETPELAKIALLIHALDESIPEESKTLLAPVTDNWSMSNAVVAEILDWALFVKAGTLGYVTEPDGTLDVRYTRISISTSEMALSDNSVAAIQDIGGYIHEKADGNPLFRAVWVSGTTAVMVDLSDNIGSEFLKIEILAVVLIILLLFAVMKSYLTPVRSVFTILMSVMWTIAITHLLFNDYLGEGVLWLIPIVLLVVCLGLGMDYDILLTTRIREYVFDKGMSNDEAIETAVLHSGSVITLCGIIMGGTFGSMMLASTGMLQQMGFALCFAILLDALIVRTYIVPAFMHLMGEWNWKGPAFMQGKRE